MLTRRTTFIVGAGASKPYGLPTAREIFEDARELGSQSALFQLVLACGVALDVLQDAVQDLRSHGGPTIDEFIEHRSHDARLVQAGKLLIAAFMGRALSQPPALDQQDDWIKHVMETISRGVATAAEFGAIVAERLTFVTFNFDTVIEEQAKQRILARYAGQHDLGRLSSSTRVLHLHGQFPPHPKEQMFLDSMTAGYTGSGVSGQWIEWTKKAADRIHLTQDDIEAAVVEAAQNHVIDCEVLCFLGFSYETNNLRKLGMPQKMAGSRELFGSAYHLSKGSRTRVESISGQTIHLGAREHRCLQMLENLYVLKDV